MHPYFPFPSEFHLRQVCLNQEQFFPFVSNYKQSAPRRKLFHHKNIHIFCFFFLSPWWYSESGMFSPKRTWFTHISHDSFVVSLVADFTYIFSNSLPVVLWVVTSIAIFAACKLFSCNSTFLSIFPGHQSVLNLMNLPCMYA